MKPHRKGKIDSTEWDKIKMIGRHNYHKFMWTRFKRKIRKKRFNNIK